jgi:hypothetical protein
MRSDSIFGFFVGAVVLAPLYAVLSILSFREYERYREEKEIEAQLKDAPMPVPLHEDESMPMNPPPPENPADNSDLIDCRMCGNPNHVDPRVSSFECVECGCINEL